MSILVFDLETSISSKHHGADAKDPVNDFYTLIFGQHEDNIIVEHREQGFKREPSDRFFMLLQSSKVLIGHNIVFDLQYIWKHKLFQQWLMNGGQIWDTQLAEYLMSGQRHSFASLAELQLIYLNEKIKEDRISKLYRKGIGADKILAAKERCPRLFKLYDKYSHGDGETTIRIYKEQLKKAEKLGMLPVIKMFQAYLLSLVQCMTTGIKVDKIKCEKTLREFNLKEIELLQKAQELVKPYWTDPRLPEFNISSNDHKSVMLFGGAIKCKVKRQEGLYKNGNPKFKTIEELVQVDGLGLSTEFTTEAKKEGFYKTGVDIVTKILKNSDNETATKFCQLQQAAANLKKMANTYLAAFLNLCINDRLYPNFNVAATATSRLSSSKPNLQNCLSDDTECLTEHGWRLIRDLSPTNKVLQVDPYTGESEFVTPKRIIKTDIQKTLCEVSTKWGTFKYTDEHRISTYTRDNNHIVETAAEFCSKFDSGQIIDRKVLRASTIKHNKKLLQCELNSLHLAVLCQAEGALIIKKDGRRIYDISVRSPRKVKQLKEFLGERVKDYFDRSRVYVDWCEVSKWLDHTKEKNFKVEILKLGYDDLESFVNYVMLWDGDYTRKRSFAQKKCRRRSVEIVQAACALIGKSTTLYKHPKKDLIVVNIHENALRYQSRTEFREVVYNKPAYCVEVATGFFLIRRKGSVLVTGNCPSKGKMAKAIQGCFVAPKGWKCVQIDFSQLEIYVTAWLSGDEAMTKDLLGGVDFHVLRLSWAASMSEGKTYQEIYDLAKVQEVPEWALKRSKAKTISYQKAYGAGANKLAESTGLHIDDVKELLEKEDSIYYRVKAFNDHVAQRVQASAEPSLSKHIPKALKKGGVHGKRFNKDGYELLPIKFGDKNIFNHDDYRSVGYYQSITGKRYAFEEYAKIDKNGETRRSFSPTQTKNYQIQGTAADIQGVTTAALLPLLLKHDDKVQFINEIHDSKLFYVREDCLKPVLTKIKQIMESTPRLFNHYLGIEMPFHVPVDIEIGDDFGHLNTINLEDLE